MRVPGERWQPSNSGDGMFMENICCTCEHDQSFQKDEGDSCEIAAKIIGLDGRPFCKSFKQAGAPYRCPHTLDLFKPETGNAV